MTMQNGYIRKKWYVKLFFFPNKIPNLSLFTEDFSLRIHTKTDLYEDLRKELEDEIVPNGLCLLVVPDFTDPGSFEFELDPNTICEWTPLGELGWKVDVCKPNNKTTTSKRKK